jgi:hypothetical protein
MADGVFVPIKTVGAVRWGMLAAFGLKHVICAEKVERIEEQFSFAGQHRLRRLVLRKNVHWEIPPETVTLDISSVVPGQPPRRSKAAKQP